MSAPAPLAGVPASAAAERCANCGNEVPQRYCGACGQKLDPPVHSLWHFSQIATEDLTHADSRLWRTLAALLFRPGHLTAEFLAGRRARYLPPLRLYLVLSVAFFLVASALQPKLAVVRFDREHATDYKVVPLEKADELPEAALKAGETPEQRSDRVCAGWNYSGPGERWLAPALQRACHRILEDNGHSLQEAFLHNIPRAMFVFLPLLAAIMALLYWRPRRYYVEHLLLCVHNHALVFLVATVVLLLGKLGKIPGLDTVLLLYFTWYIYRSMRVVYAQGRLRTLSKLALLSFFYCMFAVLLLVVTSIYSALSL